MKKYSIAICDDDIVIGKNIQTKLLAYDAALDIALFQSGLQLLEQLSDFILIFLDIEMPDMDGMTLARELRTHGYRGEIVFLTSHAEYMQEAFKVRAYRYLNKPIDDTSLIEAVENAILDREQDRKILISESFGQRIKLRLSDIVCLEAYQDGVYLYTIDKKRYRIRQTLKQWNQENEESFFFQVHKSYCINLQHVQKLRDGEVLLAGMDRWIPVSRRKSVKFKQVYTSYIRINAR